MIRSAEVPYKRAEEFQEMKWFGHGPMMLMLMCLKKREGL